jgi:hypothetical protein
MPAPTTIEARFVAAAVRLVRGYFWPHEQVSIEDVRRDALQQSLNAEATGTLVEALVRAGWLRKAPIEKGGSGRPAHRWLVNPLLWAATDNRVADEVSDDQAEAAGIAQIAEIPSAAASEPISAIPAISATGSHNASNDEEVTWTV